MRPSLTLSLASLIACIAICGCSREKRLDKSIHQAAAAGDMTALAEHLRLGHPVGSKDEAGRTPLLLAVENGRAEAVRLLLEHGAVPQPALIPAIQGGQTKLVALLVDRGADVNARAADGTTPLGAALGDRAMEALLREVGARLDPQEALRGLFKHLDVIAALMLEYKDDCQGAEKQILGHVDEHRAEIASLVAAIRAAEDGQSDAERAEVRQLTQQLMESLVKKITTAIQGFATSCPQQMATIAQAFQAFSGS